MADLDLEVKGLADYLLRIIDHFNFFAPVCLTRNQFYVKLANILALESYGADSGINLQIWQLLERNRGIAHLGWLCGLISLGRI